MGQSEMSLCPWDGQSEEEEDEEWLFSSIRQYSHLYMYSTNMHPISATMALAPDTRTLALGDKERGHLEVFRLPGKLMATSEEEEGLTSNRDFALVSGSVECDSVTGVSYIRQDMIATTNSSQSVSLWAWKAGEDLLQWSGDLCTCDFKPEGLDVKRETVTVWGDGRVGRVSPGVRMVDSRAVNMGRDTVSGVTTSDSGHVSWIVDSGGHVTTIDWRTAESAKRVRLDEGSRGDVRSVVGVTGEDRVSVVTNTGAELSVWDLRDTKTAACHGMSPPGVTCDSPMILGRDKLMLGAGPRVCLLSLSDLSSKFEHRGHRSDVTGVMCQMCHHDSDIVISCDARQGLHAWVPVL